MKTLLLHIALLLLLVLPAPAADIPELTDWWSIMNLGFNFGADFSYLPGFDTSNNGLNALAVYSPRSGKDPFSSTWYNRYFKDTVNQFSWPVNEVLSLGAADFNNDGALDYLSHDGFVFAGIQPGQPPEAQPGQEYLYTGIIAQETHYVADVNNDGYEDALNPKSSEGGNFLFSLLMGGPDLTNLKVVVVKKRPEHEYGEYFLGAFTKAPADTVTTIINLSFETIVIGPSAHKKWYSLVLRQIHVTPVADSFQVSFITIDSLFAGGYDLGREMSYTSSEIYRERKTGKEYLLAKELRSDQVYTVVYDVRENKLHKVVEFRTDNLSIETIANDINGDGYDDWGVRSGNTLYFYRGLPDGIDTIPIAQYKLDPNHTQNLPNITILGIGDVTGDSVGDLALGYDSGFGRFSIIQGQKIRPVVTGVQEQPVAGYSTPSFAMQQNYPNPVDAERKTILPVLVERAGNYTLELYTLEGRKLAVLFTGFLAQGSTKIPLDLKQYHLSAGFYSLRFGDGRQTQERGLLLR